MTRRDSRNTRDARSFRAEQVGFESARIQIDLKGPRCCVVLAFEETFGNPTDRCLGMQSAWRREAAARRPTFALSTNDETP